VYTYFPIGVVIVTHKETQGGAPVGLASEAARHRWASGVLSAISTAFLPGNCHN